MAAPNIVNISTLTGKTVVTNLTTTSATSVLNNAASSGKVFRVLMLRVVNVDGSSSVNITVNLYSEDDIGGTATELVQSKGLGTNTYLDIITRDSPLYLEEDRSLGVTASAANDAKVIVTYEDIS
jgi:hypothetical protein